MQLETNLLREDFEIETEKKLLAKKYLQMHAGVVFFPKYTRIWLCRFKMIFRFYKFEQLVDLV